MTNRVYLDWAATAPLAAQAAAAMAGAAERLANGEWANPSSVHRPGRAARQALEAARETIAAFFDVRPDAIIFTSGGTEALALALQGSERTLIGSTEHAAVRDVAPRAVRLPVDAEGRIDPDRLAASVDRDNLVAVQHANNETGVVQDIAAISRSVQAAGARLLADCVQSAGKLPLPPADLIAVSAHKLGGPAGIGALIARDRAAFPGQRGGGQEKGARGGTENLLGIIGFAAAVAAHDPAFPARARILRGKLEAAALAAGARVNGSGAQRLPTISSLALDGLPAATQLMALDMAGIAVSQGAACSSGTLKPSATLAAMGLPSDTSIRVSTGPATTEADIERFLAAWLPLAARVRT